MNSSLILKLYPVKEGKLFAPSQVELENFEVKQLRICGIISYVNWGKYCVTDKGKRIIKELEDIVTNKGNDALIKRLKELSEELQPIYE